MGVVQSLKDRLRPTAVGRLYKRLRNRLRTTVVYSSRLNQTATRQEQEYLRLCEDAYHQLPNAFSSPGYLTRSRALLSENWGGPRTVRSAAQEVRLFIIDKPNMVGPWFEDELARHFDVMVFSMSRHQAGFVQGVNDLVSYSMGIDPDDRLRKLLPLGSVKNLIEWRNRLQDDILTAVSRAHSERPIDLCFAYGSYTDFEPKTFYQIQRLGVPVALWWLDEKHLFTERPLGYPNGQEPLIGSCNVHLTNSVECIRWYMSRGAAVYYFPQAIDPEISHPRDMERDIPVSFVGAAYGWRFDFIKQLKKAGVPIECFGPGWENGVVDEAEEIYCRSQIVLGMGVTGRSRRLTCIKGRDFRVPATSSLYLTTYDYELARLFDVGREILCYRNEVDCLEQIRYYLENPELALAIGRAGHKRCVTEHTWTHRMTDFLRWTGILGLDS